MMSLRTRPQREKALPRVALSGDSAHERRRRGGATRGGACERAALPLVHMRQSSLLQYRVVNCTSTLLRTSMSYVQLVPYIRDRAGPTPNPNPNPGAEGNERSRAFRVFLLPSPCCCLVGFVPLPSPLSRASVTHPSGALTFPFSRFPQP